MWTTLQKTHVLKYFFRDAFYNNYQSPLVNTIGYSSSARLGLVLGKYIGIDFFFFSRLAIVLAGVLRTTNKHESRGIKGSSSGYLHQPDFPVSN